MLIERGTQISQLRYLGILDNMVFSILRSNGYRNVDDIMKAKDLESLGLKDYVIKSIKSFLKQTIIYDQPIAKIKEDFKFYRNPQVEQAIGDAINSTEAQKAKQAGLLLFGDLVDVVSFLQIETDDEYYNWLDQNGIDDQTEINALPVTFALLKNIRDNLYEINKYNMFLRLFDYVLHMDRFRDVARQINEDIGNDFQTVARTTPSAESSDNRNVMADIASARDFSENHFNVPTHQGEGNDWRTPHKMALTPSKFPPFPMIEDEEVIDTAKQHYVQYGYYPMFSILIGYVKKAKQMGMVRLASVMGVKETIDKDDWTRKETRRRYIDGLNRGLGIPDDADLERILKSEQWAHYKLEEYPMFSRKTFPYALIRDRENLEVSFNLVAFIICIKRKMAMINIQGDEVLTYVVPVEFTNFLYSSFINITANRKMELEDREQYKDHLKTALTKRFWRGGNLEDNRRQFITTINCIVGETLGLHADDKTVADEVDIIDYEKFGQQARPRKSTMARRNTKRKYSRGEGKPTILDAVAILLKENGRPMSASDLVDGVIKMGASDNPQSIKVTLSIGRRKNLLTILDNGLIDLVK